MTGDRVWQLKYQILIIVVSAAVAVAVTLIVEIPAVYDADSLVLILGTLPSVKSRENHFYYGHKQNRFWKVMADLCGEPVPETIEEKKKMLLAHHIAVWDVIQSCDIKGSSCP